MGKLWNKFASIFSRKNKVEPESELEGDSSSLTKQLSIEELLAGNQARLLKTVEEPTYAPVIPVVVAPEIKSTPPEKVCEIPDIQVEEEYVCPKFRMEFLPRIVECGVIYHMPNFVTGCNENELTSKNES